jgi:hypothetical protein
MSDFDQWIRSERASRQLYRLTAAPELWGSCHHVVDYVDRVSRGLPTEEIRWRSGDMPITVAGLGARIAAAWRKLSHRVARAVPVAGTAASATLRHQG